MPPQATVDAAKEVTSPLQTSPSLALLVSSLWLGVQSTAGSLFRRRPTPPSATPDRHQSPGRPGKADLHDGLGSNARSTPEFVARYGATLARVWQDHDWNDVVLLIETLRHCWREDRQVFLCGNGGSAANAVHLANDLLYGVDKQSGHGLRVTALPANPAILTCFANDISYAEVFAQQLTALGRRGDVLIAFSGSGNSPNIVRALERAAELGMTSFAVLGFSGGRALQLAEHPIHFPVDDMQVAEDLQMMVGHMVAQELARIGR